MKNKQIAVAAVLAIVLIAADQLSKIWALSALADKQIPLLGNFLSLRLIFNSGAAFSLGAGSTWIFTLIAVAACIVIPIAVWRMERYGSMLALAVIWAGAMGNLIDRLVRDPGFGRGHVVDFIDYAGVFIGNVADIELVVGVIVLLIAEALAERRENAATAVQDIEGDVAPSEAFTAQALDPEPVTADGTHCEAALHD